MYKTTPWLWPALAFVDLFGYVLFGWTRFREMGDPKSILLIRVDQLGDFLLTTPLIRALREGFPKARIDILTREVSVPLAQTNKDISDIHVYNAPWFALGGKKESWRRFFSFVSSMPKYDVVIDCHGDPRNILLASLLGTYRVGYDCRGFGFLLNKVVPYPRKYVVDRLLDLGRAIGAKSKGSGLVLNLSSADKKFVRTLKKSYITVSPFTARIEKEWNSDGWVEVIDSLPKKFHIIFIGGPADVERLRDLEKRLKRKVTVLAGKTSLRETGGVIAGAATHLCVDTVSAHISQATKTPTVCLYTHEDPFVWGHASDTFKCLIPPISPANIRDALEMVVK